VSLGILLLVILLGYVISARFIRSIRRPLEDAVDTMRNITQGNYSNVVDIARNDELGKTLQGLQMLQTRMGYEVVEAKRTADEMTRVKIALDNVSTGVMIADAGRNIIYTNHSVLRILKGAESGIRQILPNFDADNLMGKNIDIFHKNPSHQANLLATLNKTHAAKLEVGGRHLTVTASPVLNDRGERLGSVAEWLDRTDEVMVEKEVESIVYAAAQGDFSRRLALEGKTGFFLSLANGLNTLLETSATGLEEVADVLGSLAQGDLTRQVGGDYQGTFGQLKDDTNLTINQLKNIIQSIQESSELINTAAKEIAAGNTDLSSRTEEQASSLEETASSMEQLSSTVKQNAANAGDAHRVTEASRQAVEDGSLVFHKVVETMKDIHASSSKITDIIGVIDGIAFQTNILALNAAVEAARAGEQGRGFAVVATEVRSLAQRSAAAAKEIKTLIEASSSKVDEGTHLVSDASKAMESVRDSIMRVTRLVGDIASASVEQSAGIGQVSLAVSQMDEVTQQNAALVEEAAAAAESLEDQAQTLNEAVSVFRVDAGSNSGGRGVSASKSAPSHRPSASRAPVARSSTSTRSSAPSSSRSSPLPSDEGDEWAEF
jgi:methyl-accepting chemotaxis protein